MQLRDKYFETPYPWRHVIFLVDSNNVKWVVSVTTNGNLMTWPVQGDMSLPAFHFFCLTDASSVVWKVKVLTTGNLSTSNDGIAALSIPNLFLIDSSGVNWYISISAAGNLITS